MSSAVGRRIAKCLKLLQILYFTNEKEYKEEKESAPENSGVTLPRKALISPRPCSASTIQGRCLRYDDCIRLGTISQRDFFKLLRSLKDGAELS